MEMEPSHYASSSKRTQQECCLRDLNSILKSEKSIKISSVRSALHGRPCSMWDTAAAQKWTFGKCSSLYPSSFICMSFHIFQNLTIHLQGKRLLCSLFDWLLGRLFLVSSSLDNNGLRTWQLNNTATITTLADQLIVSILKDSWQSQFSRIKSKARIRSIGICTQGRVKWYKHVVSETDASSLQTVPRCRHQQQQHLLFFTFHARLFVTVFHGQIWKAGPKQKANTTWRQLIYLTIYLFLVYHAKL